MRISFAVRRSLHLFSAQTDRKYQTCLITGFCDTNNKKSQIFAAQTRKFCRSNLSRITSALAKFASSGRLKVYLKTDLM